MIDAIRLNHTVWYSYEKKIIRINISDMLPQPSKSYSYTVSGRIEYLGLVKVHSISKDIKVFGDFDPLLFLYYAPLSGSSEENKKDDWNSRVELKWDEQHKSFDIVLPPHKDFNVDGEMVVTIYYTVYNGFEEGYTEDSSSFMNKQYKLDVVIPFSSHNNPNNPNNPLYGENAYTNVAIRNDKTNIIGTLDEPVVYECELVNRDVSDENPSYRDVLDMIKIEGRKDVELELDNDTLTVKVGGLMSSVNLAKYRDENTNNTLNVEDLKRDILSIVDGKLPNVETIKQEILADVNPRIPDKETLKNEILAAVPTPSATPYELTPNKMTQALHDNEIQRQGFIDYVFANSNYSGNLKLVKTDDSYEIRYTYNQRENEVNQFSSDYKSIMTIPFSSLREMPSSGGSITLDSILEALKDDTKENVLTQIKEKLSIVNTDTLKHELLNALPAKDDYNLSYDGVSLYLTKTNDSSYMKSVQITPEISIEKMNAEVITSKLKPELDKSYYSKQEVDQLIQQLKHELMSEDHSEEHPQ